MKGLLIACGGQQVIPELRIRTQTAGRMLAWANVRSTDLEERIVPIETLDAVLRTYAADRPDKIALRAGEATWTSSASCRSGFADQDCG